MKKLLFPILVSIMMLMFFSCKSDTPVQANADTGSVISLQKSTHFNAYRSGNFVILTWQSYGGAKYYITHYSLGSTASGYHNEPVVHGQKNYQYQYDVSGFTNGNYLFYLYAYNGKDQVITGIGYPVIISNP